MEIFVSTLPVLLFLAFLFLLDSFKLVVNKLLAFALLWGLASAGMAYFLNNSILDNNVIGYDFYSRYVAPLMEEGLKSLFIFLLIFQKRIGFFIDAAIYGFAVGTGFALAENVVYLYNTAEHNVVVFIVRGFGTAMMHGGCTALIAILLIGAKNRGHSFLRRSVLALLAAYLLHSLYNHFYIHPLLQTMGVILAIPAIFTVLFRKNEQHLHQWLEMEFSSEIELLQMMSKGTFGATRAGEYLTSLKSRFSGEAIVDMYCYIRLYLELSVKAKRNLMLKESGFPLIRDADIESKLTELAALRKQIGKVGEITLAPLIRMNYRDLWKFNLLK